MPNSDDAAPAPLDTLGVVLEKLALIESQLAGVRIKLDHVLQRGGWPVPAAAKPERAPATPTPGTEPGSAGPHLLDTASTVGMELETVAIRLDTAVSTIQHVMESLGNREGMLVDILGGQRDTIGEQGDKLREYQERLWSAAAKLRGAGATIERALPVAPQH